MAISTQTCTVSVSLTDILDADVGLTENATLYVENPRSFFHGNEVIAKFQKSVAFDGSGDASIAVIETATPGKKLNFKIVYDRAKSKTTIYFKPAEIPNQSTAQLSDLTTVDRFQD